MPAHIRILGAFKQVRHMYIQVGGAWKNVNFGFIREAGVWKQFHQRPLVASLSPASVSAFEINCPATTDLVEAFPTGGVSPYTYLWSRVSGAVHVIQSPTAKSTRFQSTGGSHAGTGLYRCQVTDSDGPPTVVFTGNCSVEVECGT